MVFGIDFEWNGTILMSESQNGMEITYNKFLRAALF